MSTPAFYNATTAEGTTPSFSFDTGTNAGRYVFCVTLINPAETVTGITLGGTALASVSTFADALLGWNVQGWELINAPSGVNTLTVSESVGIQNVYLVVASWDTCDTVSPVENRATFTTGDGNVNGGAIGSASGKLVVLIGEDYAGGNAVDTSSEGTGVTKDFLSSGGSVKIGGYVLRKAGAASVTITDTLTCSNSSAVLDNFGYSFSLKSPESAGIVAIGGEGSSGGGIGTFAAGNAG